MINHIYVHWQWMKLDLLELEPCDFEGLKGLVYFLV